MAIDIPSLAPLSLSVLAQAEGGEAIALPVSVPLGIVLIIASILGYALVNTIEIAVVGASRIRVRHLAEAGSSSAQALERVRGREDRFFSGIVVLQNLFVFLASAMSSLVALDLFGAWGLVVAMVFMPAMIALFGEVTPKVLAAKAADPVALFFARPVELLIQVLRPVVVIVAAAPNIISRVLFRSEARVTPTVSEAELRMLIDIAAEEEAVGEEEAELMERVFRFYDRRANEVLVPRTEVVWLEAGTPIADFYRVFNEAPHSRFPVYRDTIDNVVGTVNIKDVLRAAAQGRAGPDTPIDGLMRAAYFAPETKLIGALFVEMQERRQQMAVIVDEYGGTAGIVTLELLLEEMVGRVVDELGRPEEEFQTIDERTVRVDGGMSVHEAREELGLPIPDGDYETVAGYVLDTLGHIPKVGETVQVDGFRITVVEMKGRKIEQVVVTRLPAETTASGEAAARD